ncbi:MAG: S-layer homology domain-containing protein [Clostridiales bacterium]|nr:S-layer homology domain-containing protein [Clostridiales bacterium]
MKKIFLPALLCAAMVTAMLPAPAQAASSTVSETEMAQVLAALDIMVGDQNGNLNLDDSVTRAQFTKLTIAASPMGDSVGAATTVSPYPDVPYTHWAAPYVEAAVSAGYVNGFLDGTFHPDETVTLAMGVTMVTRLLGYTDTDFSGAWPSGQMTLYHNLDLDEGISAGQDSPMTRRDAMCLFYNLLTAKTKSGQVYLTTLGHSLTASGEMDRLSLINSAMKGPVILDGDWQSKVDFPVSTAKVYRNGRVSSLDALQSNDVIYWSGSMRTLWAYSSKVTGLYQAVSPSSSNPASVTVAGKTYAIETSDAAYALSNLGSFKTGDSVTLLLGRDGGVAAVVPAGSVSGTRYGVVTSVSNSSYTDTDGNNYTAKTVTLTATDGNSYSYPVGANSSLKAGDLIQVTTAGGSAQVTRLSQSSISGKVNAAATQIGTFKLADDVEILDMNSDGAARRIYPSRLSGIRLDSSDVKFYRKNSSGEVDVLILNDFTGDLCSYGVLTSVSEVDQSAGGMSALYGSYQYDVGGQTYTYVLQNGVLNLSTGPVKIEGSLLSPNKISKLTPVKLQSLDSTSAVDQSGNTLPVYDSAAVYELENNVYRLSSLERVRTGYHLTGYYDKDPADGGCLRVIVARPA